ncbi:MAG: high-affinity branched-chain amino acid ABC transporter ATP-binding protein LivG [Candidatus Schekmanbacteria bacterium RBG_13_48_7]|uniref:High-affinity branched-chain amino acid ABC transporter ATP-binding protein LivG n=1 Tax=Candidatus Schekmanbacteria bacterium RBG_13_48_7 TaxID=1817878 RepID=A0A1F7S130_9BACT|nr:MAG: high-affinity branched-chain amino acid ABC transporter ATP-binding protein LivG [Candidatus Schekmanbacteria bacterium RBG_13_48_7]
MMLMNLNNITMRFGGLTALSDIRIQIEKGDLVGLIGPNGSGKTTLFNVITGIYKPTHGTVYFNNENITGLRPDLVAKKGIARTFQNIMLLKALSVLDNVMVACHVRLQSSWIGAVLRVPGFVKEEKLMKEKSNHLLEIVGLQNKRHFPAESLPYGEQRRLEIARALAVNPELLLLDEPAAGMNPQETQSLMDFIIDIKQKLGLTILIIDHDMKVIMGICRWMVVLDSGEIIARGTPNEIQNNTKVIQAYLGVMHDAQDN